MDTTSNQVKRMILSLVLTVVICILSWPMKSYSQSQSQSQSETNQTAVLNDKKIDPLAVQDKDLNQTFKYLHLLLYPDANIHAPIYAELAPCQTMEIRVASQTANGLFFKEGVGSVFKVTTEKARSFLLTVGHLVSDQKVMIGVCNNKYYNLRLIAVDTSIDTAVIEIDSSSDGLSPLFIYQKGFLPQILQVEKLDKAGYSNLKWEGIYAIETLNPELLNSAGAFYLQTAKDYRNSKFSPLLRFDRRSVLTNADGDLVAEKTSVLPGSDWVYKLTKNGVKPGMSGSPVFFYRKSGLRVDANEFDPNVIMVGVVSKTRINSTESALIPFNVIYKNLEILLSGNSKTDLSISNDTLVAQGKRFKNLGAALYKNSADEIPMPRNLNVPMSGKISQKIDIQSQLENLLKNPQELKNLKKDFNENKVGGADWGDGNGDLARGSTPQQFYTAQYGLFSIYLDPSYHEASGVVDENGIEYFGVRRGRQFYALKSVYSLAPFIGDLSGVVSQNGVKDKAEAFQLLCQNSNWINSNRKYSEELRAYGSAAADSRQSKYSNWDPKLLYAYCLHDKIYFYTSHPYVQASLIIDKGRISGEMSVLGCRTKVNVDSNNIWERSVSNENFDAKIEIGDGTDFLLKVNFFKIKKTCQGVQSDQPVWSQINLLSTMVVK